MKVAALAGCLAVCAVCTDVRAQTLGDVARQEEARRKTVKAPAKVYTNDNLRAETPAAPTPATTAPATPAPAAPAPAAAPGSGTTPSAAASKGGAPPAADGAVKDEAYWRKRVSGARDALERNKTFAEALQTRINALTADFSSHDDPLQRAKIGSDRDKALAELTRVQKDIQDNTKAIAAVQEEARSTGVPAGWVR